MLLKKASLAKLGRLEAVEDSSKSFPANIF